MKNVKLSRSLCCLMVALLSGPATRAQDTAVREEGARRSVAADAPKNKPSAAGEDRQDSATAKGDDSSNTADSNRSSGRALRPGSDKMLRLNFRGVPLEMVLNYLSDAAGFIIVLDTEVRGKVDVWSNQPVTQDEALGILDAVLSKNGYSAIRNGRTLTIVSKESAKKRDIPVKSGSNPSNIPKTEEIVTQIIPIRFISASQLTQNLQSLLPSSSELTANEAGNALIMTDTQINIRRITEIIRALDTSIAGATTIKVFPLRFADSKELANVIKELFPAQDSRTGGGNNTGGFGGFNGFGNRGPGQGGFGGGGFPGGNFGGGNNAAGRTGGAGNNRASASRVVAVADERSNSVIINAPDDVLPEIEELITRVDTSVEDITELRVFRLRYADPSEMSEVLSGLFPDDSRNSDSARSQVRFGGGFGFGGGGGTRTAAAGADSSRAKKKGKVLAIPDQRTSSVIVSAAHELMDQIGEVVAQLDSNPARKQKVFVYDLQNADPQQVQEVLRNLFENQQTQNRNNRSSQNQSSALTTRASQQNNNNNRTTTGFGGGGNGGGGGGGRTGGN